MRVTLCRRYAAQARFTSNTGCVDDTTASASHRTWQPDEHIGTEWFHPRLASAWRGGAKAARHSGGVGTLVHRLDGGDRNGAAAHDPRLFRLPETPV